MTKLKRYFFRNTGFFFIKKRTMKNKIPLIVTFVILIVGFTNLKAQSQLEEKYKHYEELSNIGMNYGLFKPIKYNPKTAYPIVLYLHGYTDTVSHDLDWYNESFQKENPCFVVSPKCYGNPHQGGGWVDILSGKLSVDGKKAIEILDLTIKTYNIDTTRIYIHGGSMGGFGTFGALLNLPGKFTAAYIVCGGTKMENAKNLITMPLWIFHGQMDDVVPVQLSRNIYGEIKRLGGEMVRYTEYPGVKHNSWENVSKEKTLKSWLFKQKKGETCGNPDKPENLTIEATHRNIILRWDLPTDRSNTNNDIWYYKIFRNDIVLAEVDGDVNRYIDNVFLDHEIYSYSIIAVNYYFKESEVSDSVKIEN